MYRISKNEYLIENYTSTLTYNGYEFMFFILIVQGDEVIRRGYNWEYISSTLASERVMVDNYYSEYKSRFPTGLGE